MPNEEGPQITIEEDLPQPSRGPGVIDLLLALALIWGVDLVAGLILAAISGLDPSKDPNPFHLLAATLVTWPTTLGVIWYFSAKKHSRSFRESFHFHPVSALAVAASVGTGVILAIIITYIMSVYGTQESMMSRIASTPEGFAVICILALAVAPLEELYYRGFIYPILEKLVGTSVTIPLVIFWFTGVHVLQLLGDPLGIVMILIVATIFTLQRHFSKSLIPSIATHWSYNAAIVGVALMSGP